MFRLVGFVWVASESLAPCWPSSVRHMTESKKELVTVSFSCIATAL